MSKAIERAKRWENRALNFAVKAFARYQKAVDYRRMLEATEGLRERLDEHKKTHAEMEAQMLEISAKLRDAPTWDEPK